MVLGQLNDLSMKNTVYFFVLTEFKSNKSSFVSTSKVFEGGFEMGKLAEFVAMKRDLAFEFERELRSVRNLILGVTRLSGTCGTIDLAAADGFVAGSQARTAFLEAFHAAAHEMLVKYAHDLAHESLEHGVDHDVVGNALAGRLPQDVPCAAPEPAEPIVEEMTFRMAG